MTSVVVLELFVLNYILNTISDQRLVGVSAGVRNDQRHGWRLHAGRSLFF